MEQPADLVPGLDPAPARVDIDLDAAAEKSLCDAGCGHCSGAIYRYTHRVNPRALLARLAKVEAERDALDGQIGELAKFIMDEIPGEPSRSEGAIDVAIRLLRSLAAENDRLRQDYDACRRQLDEVTKDALRYAADALAARPVVEAAEAWRNDWTVGSRQLMDAVDAYRAGQNTPAQRGVQAPADPPGLDAAIEAAEAVFAAARCDQSYPMYFLDLAIRAAAPALRAGALREAADAWYVVSDDPDTGDWLRERADRIGGAT